MFRPGAPIEEIERDVESIIVDLVHKLGDLADADARPEGANERAYIKVFSDAHANSDRDQAAMLSTAVNRPNLAESLIYLNRRLDGAALDPTQPTSIIGILVRLAMDGLWVSDILDPNRFTGAQRTKVTEILTSLSYLANEQVAELTQKKLTGAHAPGAA